MARSGILYGPTNTFKTTQVAFFARWIAETTGKATLLFSTDGGGWAPCQEEVDAGMIRPFHCDVGTTPLAQIRAISKGYWPINPEEPDILKVKFSPVKWDEIGGIAVEGLTSIGSVLMRHCADNNLKTGQEGTNPVKVPILMEQPDGTDKLAWESFAGNSQGHYNFVQNQLFSLVTNFQSLPVAYVLFTAHEKKYKEDGAPMSQYGISVPGNAITPLVPTWIGDCLHAQDYKVPVKQRVPSVEDPSKTVEEETIRTYVRYYFVKHPDPDTGLLFDAKPRVTHSKARELEKVFPGGFFVPTPERGLDMYLRAVDKLAQDAVQSDALKAWREKMDAKLGRTQNVAVAKSSQG